MKYLFVWLIILSNFTVFSQNNAFEIDQNKMNELYPDAHKVLIFDSISADVKESGLSYVTRKQLFYAKDEKGASSLSTITYDYDPLSAYVEIKKAVIYRADGSVEELGAERVYDYPQPARMIYWGARRKMVEPGYLAPGDAVYVELFRKGFTYALLQGDNDDDKYIPPMRGHYYDIVRFYESYPVHNKFFKTAIPISKEVRYQVFNGDFEVKTDRNEKQIFTFQLGQVKPISREPNMVGMDDVIPKVLITTSPDWEAKSIWFYKVNEDFGSFESTPEIDAKVAEILKGATTEQDSIERLTHWVADEIRYSGISMGEGEGYTLHTGEMTFTDRCGVCKDKAGMLIVMLRAAGFESYAAMTMAGSRIEDIPADQFNHSITVIKRRNGKYELLDPTWVPFVRELWSSREQQQNYLIGLPDGADLMITDVSDASNHYLKISNNATIDEKGNLTGTIEVSAEGQSDAAVRGIFTYYYQSQWKANLEKELQSIYPQAEITKITNTNPYQYVAGPVSIYYEYSIPEFAIVDDNSYIFNSLTNSGFMEHNRFGLGLRTNLDERKYGFRIRCSQEVKIDEKITFPGKIKQVVTPESVDNKSESASVKAGWDKSKKDLTFQVHSRFEKRKYKPTEWSAVKSVVSDIKKFQTNPIQVKIK
ncbi:MAG: transglutaminase [Salinivirgaceae bacterium]|nr:MAG: transglutaminase [Salinivirgaceae bacterium]